MKLFLDVTGIKNHPDINSVYDFLVEKGFSAPCSEELASFVEETSNVLAAFAARSIPHDVPVAGGIARTRAALSERTGKDGSRELTLVVLVYNMEPLELQDLDQVVAWYTDYILTQGHQCILSGDTLELHRFAHAERNGDQMKPKKYRVNYKVSVFGSQVVDDAKSSTEVHEMAEKFAQKLQGNTPGSECVVEYDVEEL